MPTGSTAGRVKEPVEKATGRVDVIDRRRAPGTGRCYRADCSGIAATKARWLGGRGRQRGPPAGWPPWKLDHPFENNRVLLATATQSEHARKTLNVRDEDKRLLIR